MKTQKNKLNTNKILLSNIEYSTSKKGQDLSIGNLYTSDYSTLFTNSNTNTVNKIFNLENVPITLSPLKNNVYNTIDDYSRDMFYLSKINLEHDLYLSSLKKKLAIAKDEKKQSEIKVIKLKKKIMELKKEEKKVKNQLENTKKYIQKIIENRKKHNKTKKYNDIKIAKINNIFPANKSPNSKIYNQGKFNCNTWLVPNKKRTFIKNKNFLNTHFYSQTENNLSNKTININNKLIENFNSKKEKNNQTIETNSFNNKIYCKKKVICNNIKMNKKEFLIKKLKKDEEEKNKIQKLIEEIEKEQNSLFNNFKENFKVYNSSKIIDLSTNKSQK